MNRPIRNHVQAAILRAIAAEAGADSSDREKPILIVEDVRSTDWASATFVGARHQIDIRLDGAPEAAAIMADRLTSRLPERDIPICGHIVAEIAATLVRIDKQNVNMKSYRLSVNVLTIID